MPRIAIGDCQLYYERHGAGFPVLFLSGLGGYGAFWRDRFDKLENLLKRMDK